MILADPFLVPIVMFVVAGASTIGYPIARALARRIDRDTSRPKLPADVTDRLERMEQAIDAIAIEIERISEGQRFTTKLLTDRPRDGAMERLEASPQAKSRENT